MLSDMDSFDCKIINVMSTVIPHLGHWGFLSNSNADEIKSAAPMYSIIT